MTDEAKKRLHDVLEACRAIGRFTAGKDSRWLPAGRAIARRGGTKIRNHREAFSKLAEGEPDVAQSFPELPRIVGLRNRLIHGYDSVDDGIVWDIVKNKLPKLQSEVERLMSQS